MESLGHLSQAEAGSVGEMHSWSSDSMLAFGFEQVGRVSQSGPGCPDGGMRPVPQDLYTQADGAA